MQQLRKAALILLLVLSPKLWGAGIEERDKEILTPFFRELLTKETLGYVLTGEKPVAFLGYISELSWKHPFRSILCLRSYLSPTNQMAKKGWEIWKKYEAGLSERFLIVKEQSPNNPLSIWIFVLNREAFCKAVDENISDFESVLGRNTSGAELFKEARTQPLFSKVLNKHEGLLGIVLGYGRNNAWLYAEGDREKMGFFPHKIETDILLPSFRVDWEDPETSLLEDKYMKAREKVLALLPDPVGSVSAALLN